LIEAIRPKVQTIAGRLLAPAEASGQMDIIRDYANLLPVHVMAEVLGLPEESRAHLKQWSGALAAFLGGPPSIALAENALHAVLELEDYFRAQIAERRRQPRDDLLTSMIAAGERGAFLSEHEIVATSTMLLFGGHETTTNLIGNGVLSLLENPSEEAILRASPDRIAHAVEELLRYESPLKRLRRMALEDIEIAGVPIKKGELVFPVVASANRDPDQFPDPDRLDVRRSDVRHLALGLGAHYCSGVSLVRLEGQIAFEALL
jgi:cytochrome P450